MGGRGDVPVIGHATPPHARSISNSALMSSNPQGQSVPNHQSSCNSGLFNEGDSGDPTPLRSGALECGGPSGCLQATPLLQNVDRVSREMTHVTLAPGEGVAGMAIVRISGPHRGLWQLAIHFGLRRGGAPFICGERDRQNRVQNTAFKGLISCRNQLL